MCIRDRKEGLQLKELAPGWDFDSVQHLTEPRLLVAPDLKEMDFTLPNDSTVSKIHPTSASAVADVFDGATILMDGFGGLGGMSHYLMMALRDQGAKNLTIVGNTAGIARVSSFGTTPSRCRVTPMPKRWREQQPIGAANGSSPQRAG